MTVSDLIRELQQYPPALPVRVLLPGVWIGGDDGRMQPLVEGIDDSEAYDVRHQGAYILITGK